MFFPPELAQLLDFCIIEQLELTTSVRTSKTTTTFRESARVGPAEPLHLLDIGNRLV